MSKLFEKLNWKGQPEILVIHAPESFEIELAALSGVRILRDIAAVQTVEFALSFVTRQAELDRLIEEITARVKGDGIIWFAYPKTASKKYRCEFNRDTGWAKLGEAGFEGVRQVAIDEDWSALRFRRVEYIKTLTRDVKRAGSAEGKKRTQLKS